MLGARQLDQFVARAVLHQGLERVHPIGHLESVQRPLAEPRAEHAHAGETVGIGQPQAVGHAAALAEAQEDELAAVRGVAPGALVQERPQPVAGGKEGRGIDLASQGHGEPGVSGHARAQRHLQRRLRTDDPERAAAQMRRQPQEVHGVGAAPMERQDRRMRPLAFGLVYAVKQFHRGAPPFTP